MLEYLVYLIYRAGFALISLFPLRLLFTLGRALGFCGWLLLPKYRQLAFRNIDIAFEKEKSPREIRRIVRQHFQMDRRALMSSETDKTNLPLLFRFIQRFDDTTLGEIQVRVVLVDDLVNLP